MAYISSMKLPDNVTYDLKDARVAVPVPADAVFTDHIFSGLAEDVDYDNTTSGLTSTNVQDALDEIADGGGGSTGCVELTQAEYDALSREEKNADVIYLITDSPDNYLDEVFGDFASVEYTSTASKTYAVGDYLVYNSKFYKVTSAIAQGGTITPGTNVVKTNVGDEIDALEDEKYEKPSGGIPASDLSSAVQTSLGKADMALQSADVAGKYAEEKTVDVTAVNGTLSNTSVTQEGKLVSGYISISGLTAAAHSWLNLCRISARPNVNVVAHAFLSLDGSDCAIIRFNSDQDMVHVYPIKALDSVTINFMFSYRTV